MTIRNSYSAWFNLNKEKRYDTKKKHWACMCMCKICLLPVLAIEYNVQIIIYTRTRKFTRIWFPEMCGILLKKVRSHTLTHIICFVPAIFIKCMHCWLQSFLFFVFMLIILCMLLLLKCILITFTREHQRGDEGRNIQRQMKCANESGNPRQRFY